MSKRDKPSHTLPTAGPPEPQVVKALSRPVLERLRAGGAASVTELLQARIRFWDVPLDRDEIELSLDLARRLELITAWREAPRPDGRPASALEWALTPTGRTEMTSLGPLLSRLGSWVGAGVRTLTPLVAALGLAGALHGFHPTPVIIFGPIYVLLGWLLVWWLPRFGASPTILVAGWPRLRTEHPEVAERIRADVALMRRAGCAGVALLMLEGLLGLWARPPPEVVGLVFLGYAALAVWLLRAWRRVAHANSAVRRRRTLESMQLTLDLC
jgi:hypothetical protein